MNDIAPTDGAEPVGHVTRVPAAMLSRDVIKDYDPGVVVSGKSSVVLEPVHVRSGSADGATWQRRSATWWEFYVPDVTWPVSQAMHETRHLCTYTPIHVQWRSHIKDRLFNTTLWQLTETRYVVQNLNMWCKMKINVRALKNTHRRGRQSAASSSRRNRQVAIPSHSLFSIQNSL